MSPNCASNRKAFLILSYKIFLHSYKSSLILTPCEIIFSSCSAACVCVEGVGVRCVCVLGHSVMSNSLWPPGTVACSPWDFPGKNTGVGRHVLPQGIFPTHGSKLHFLYLLPWRADSLPLHHLGNSNQCYTIDNQQTTVTPKLHSIWLIFQWWTSCLIIGWYTSEHYIVRFLRIGVNFMFFFT